jgi:hypothetical protein
VNTYREIVVPKEALVQLTSIVLVVVTVTVREPPVGPPTKDDREEFQPDTSEVQAEGLPVTPSTVPVVFKVAGIGTTVAVLTLIVTGTVIVVSGRIVWVTVLLLKDVTVEIPVTERMAVSVSVVLLGTRLAVAERVAVTVSLATTVLVTVTLFTDVQIDWVEVENPEGVTVTVSVLPSVTSSVAVVLTPTTVGAIV